MDDLKQIKIKLSYWREFLRIAEEDILLCKQKINMFENTIKKMESINSHPQLLKRVK